MDKIKLSAMGAPAEPAVSYVQIGDATIEITTQLPYEQVLDMIQFCIDHIINDRPFISEPMKVIVKNCALLKFYTNLDMDFLDNAVEMREIYEEYDLIDRFEVIDRVTAVINQTDSGARQLEFFNNTLDATLQSIMAYRNSAMGIVDALSDAAKSSTNNMQEAIDMLGDEEQNQKLIRLLNFAEQIQG